ncbi:class I SAM-dependent methyltransferase [Haloimpatiens sp. FM7330]|uniref:class I SAM-dependent methyltransferase n=1 Tax=Haloimpatiens sp. FM7330 TaxID=3298610 RepID=UPI0036335CFE
MRIGEFAKKQYKTAENLNSRCNLHSYNINKVDWDNWCFSKMRFPKKAKILEIGCGTGRLWSKNRQYLNKEWSITLADFSKGMLKSTKEELEELNYNFMYKEFDIQSIPYEDESFDVVIARHMLYLVPNIEKALFEIKRVLTRGGLFYATTNTPDAMYELNELMKKFDPKIGLSNNGMGERFDSESGQLLLTKYFDKVKKDILSGKIVVDKAEPVVSYKASTIKGSTVLVGEKRQQLTKYIEDYIRENGNISITTGACIFEAKK